MSIIDSDVSYALVNEAVALYQATDLDVVLSLASTCRVIRHAALSVLFAQVHWPHANKHDEESGLHFFPAALWPYFRRFHLVWPEDWPEATPPRWGDRYYVGGDYNPRHIDKLVAALPAMPALAGFYLNCPFYPPNSLLNALIKCPALRDLSINETPLSISMSPRVPSGFYLDRLSIVPVAEAVRVGDGPFDRRYAERTYYVREYRKKYKNDVLARRATTAFLFEVGKTACIRHVQLSMDLCTLQALAEDHWPVLDTLILTGHAPRGELLDVLVKMPALRELRLLFAKVKGELGLRVLSDDLSGSHTAVLRQLEHLAVSNACNLENVFRYTHGLERLAILAIIDLPRVPIALSRVDVERILADLAMGHRVVPSRLRRLRIMIEDKVNPDLCSAIGRHCPNLEALEIELCGYHDGKSIHAWEEFSEAFAPMALIRELRICIQFPEFDEMDTYEPWRAARQECAQFLAGRIQNLQRVGFEYRKRIGTHRFEDNWLEFEVERDGGARVVGLRECGPTWYPFPEVWIPVAAQYDGTGIVRQATTMSSACPPQLHLELPANTTSFKRSFDQFGFDLDSPQGPENPAATSGAADGHDRNKRARSASSFSDASSTLASGSSHASSLIAPPGRSPPRLPTPEIQDIVMAEAIPRSPTPPPVLPPLELLGEDAPASRLPDRSRSPWSFWPTDADEQEEVEVQEVLEQPSSAADIWSSPTALRSPSPLFDPPPTLPPIEDQVLSHPWDEDMLDTVWSRYPPDRIPQTTPPPAEDNVSVSATTGSASDIASPHAVPAPTLVAWFDREEPWSGPSSRGSVSTPVATPTVSPSILDTYAASRLQALQGIGTALEGIGQVLRESELTLVPYFREESGVNTAAGEVRRASRSPAARSGAEVRTSAWRSVEGNRFRPALPSDYIELDWPIPGASAESLLLPHNEENDDGASDNEAESFREVMERMTRRLPEPLRHESASESETDARRGSSAATAAAGSLERLRQRAVALQAAVRDMDERERWRGTAGDEEIIDEETSASPYVSTDVELFLSPWGHDNARGRERALPTNTSMLFDDGPSAYTNNRRPVSSTMERTSVSAWRSVEPVVTRVRDAPSQSPEREREREFERERLNERPWLRSSRGSAPATTTTLFSGGGTSFGNLRARPYVSQSSTHAHAHGLSSYSYSYAQSQAHEAAPAAGSLVSPGAMESAVDAQRRIARLGFIQLQRQRAGAGAGAGADLGRTPAVESLFASASASVSARASARASARPLPPRPRGFESSSSSSSSSSSLLSSFPPRSSSPDRNSYRMRLAEQRARFDGVRLLDSTSTGGLVGPAAVDVDAHADADRGLGLGLGGAGRPLRVGGGGGGPSLSLSLPLSSSPPLPSYSHGHGHGHSHQHGHSNAPSHGHQHSHSNAPSHGHSHSHSNAPLHGNQHPNLRFIRRSSDRLGESNSPAAESSLFSTASGVVNGIGNVNGNGNGNVNVNGRRSRFPMLENLDRTTVRDEYLAVPELPSPRLEFEFASSASSAPPPPPPALNINGNGPEASSESQSRDDYRDRAFMARSEVSHAASTRRSPEPLLRRLERSPPPLPPPQRRSSPSGRLGYFDPEVFPPGPFRNTIQSFWSARNNDLNRSRSGSRPRGGAAATAQRPSQSQSRIVTPPLLPPLAFEEERERERERSRRSVRGRDFDSYRNEIDETATAHLRAFLNRNPLPPPDRPPTPQRFAEVLHQLDSPLDVLDRILMPQSNTTRSTPTSDDSPEDRNNLSDGTPAWLDGDNVSTRRPSTSSYRPPWRALHPLRAPPNPSSDIHSLLNRLPRTEAIRREAHWRPPPAGSSHTLEALRNEVLNNGEFDTAREPRTRANASPWGILEQSQSQGNGVSRRTNANSDHQLSGEVSATQRRRRHGLPIRVDPFPAFPMMDMDDDVFDTATLLQDRARFLSRRVRGPGGEAPVFPRRIPTLMRSSNGVRRGRPLGDYIPDEDWNSDYESLLSLAAQLGEVKPRSTPADVINSMETGLYKDWKTADSDHRCPICLDDYQPDDYLLKLTDCSHWLHRECLQQWLKGATTCPVCRETVVGTSRGMSSDEAGPSQRRSSEASGRSEGEGEGAPGTAGSLNGLSSFRRHRRFL